ncbi:chlorophyll a/b-binding protein [Pantanalinema sp. GBBB05]|uniref:chlorophyll a/b-binding protein n=1 Tax=Pantanalinema sp. GBBB05 TaxID=2604139 RepID=UPI001D6A44AE|nr:chlorophyll A-B binding protein [Pantanalinema sp. GBBB05]
MSSEIPPKPLPTPEPEQPEPAFGWTAYAEQINGRFAMLGMLGLLLIELLTKQGLLAWLGLQ